MEKSRQKRNVLYHLQQYKKITSLTAIQMYGITRLASVIHRLRQEGYDIETERDYSLNRYGDNVNYACYLYHGYNGLDNTLAVKKLREGKS